MKINHRAVVSYVAGNPDCSRSQILADVAPAASSTTMWRSLRRLVDAGRLQMVGEGRATRYRVAGREVVLSHLRAPYQSRPRAPYRRGFMERYRPNETRYLTDADLAELTKAGTPTPDPPLDARGVSFARRVRAELEIDMSWASSRMEGNSYDEIDTQVLVQSGGTADGKPFDDAVMIINHRDAIRYVATNIEDIEIGWPDLRNIHSHLAGRGVIRDRNLVGALRRMPVKIGRSAYEPLGDRFALRDELDSLLAKAAQIADPFEAAFFLMVHIPYLQPFADVNKRTSRVAALIPLLKADMIPMSFVSISDRDYVKGLLGVYELNDVSLLRETFVNGYVASAEPYRHLRPGVADPTRVEVVHDAFTRRAVHRCVRERSAFEPDLVRRMMAEADIPRGDRGELLEHVGYCYRSLTRGNAIIYGLTPQDVEGLAHCRQAMAS